MMFMREWIFQKALPVGELNRLLYEDPKSERLRRTGYRCLMFQFCGMSFADLAHLEKSSLERNIIRYNRIKTENSDECGSTGYCTGYNLVPASQLSAFSSGLSRLSVQYPSWRQEEKMKVHTGNIVRSPQVQSSEGFQRLFG